MASFSRFYAAFQARNKEFIRDRMAMTWNLIFPVMLIIGFTMIFSQDERSLFKVGVFKQADRQLPFLQTQYIQFIKVDQLNGAINKVSRHQLDMLLDLSVASRYWVNSSSPNGYILEKILQPENHQLLKKQAEGEEVSYVDWLLPGVLGMNVMFSCLFGVGYVIVRYRKNGVLKRLKATPLTALEFLSAQIFSRLIVVMTVLVLVYACCKLLIGFQMRGSYIDLFIVALAGAFCMISLGLVVAARINNEEFANGLLNIMSWPMMMLSGVWFSLEGSPDFILFIADLLPLTHLITAARDIMNNGVSLSDVSYHLGMMMIMSIICLFIGTYSFRWE